MLSDRSIVVVTKEQVSCGLGEDAVVLDLKAGVYYGLNPVGAHVWNLIQGPKTVGEIRDAILAEYEVDPDRCDSDLRVLLRDLADRNLIEVKGEAPA